MVKKNDNLSENMDEGSEKDLLEKIYITNNTGKKNNFQEQRTNRTSKEKRNNL
jgi:hypothetical protein